MSVELTTMAIETLPVRPQKGQENDQQPIKNLAGIESSVGNKLIATRQNLEPGYVDQISKKETQDEDKAMSTAQLEKVAKQLQEFIGQMNRGLEFSVDEDSGRDVIKVLDKTSGELIKQYPTEEVLSLVAKLSEATGNFVDSKV
jgi:flagellar protein FlaG